MKKEWFGTDASLEISLHEYGMVATAGKDYEDEYFVLYKVSDNAYDTGYIRENELNNLMKGNSWVEPQDILKFTGLTLDEWMELSFIHKLSDLVGYYGFGNLMGSSYHTITKKEADKLIA